ncbi:MAG TPA: alpha/beta hydrolase [Chthoniobacterales bacterium]|jgi:pimeloyl-ACP methyl ester carboxylesterase|nr:alpha/beta hydrolase [Chthoniobacterales bacterium]
MESCQFVSLGTRGRLAFCEYGDAWGVPVFFFHGWPSSRTMGEFADQAARELNVRIISPDRPGICDSTFQANRRLLDWPNDLQVLADHLRIPRFHILAFSGGAPYAYVAGLKMPERVRGMAIVSGAVPFADLRDHGGLLPLYRWMVWFYRNQPALLRASFRLVRPLMSWRTSARTYFHTLPRPDADVLRDNAAFQVIFESQRRAWSGPGAYGVMADAEIYGRPWGFRLEDVDVPVRLWHGKQDRAFSYRVADETAKRLPNCVARYIDNEGHFSLPIRHMHEILADLISI